MSEDPTSPHLIPVHFVYLDEDGAEDMSTQFKVHCVAVPRVGETVVPQAGSGPKVVMNVYHKVVASPHGALVFITIVLRDRAAQ